MNNLPTTDLTLEQKIWRYMDLTKFTLMLAHQSLYFACLTELDDPFEGYMPRSHAKAMSESLAPLLSESFKMWRMATAEDGGKVMDDLIQNTKKAISYRTQRSYFGVSCWHGNDDESEAMWRTYSALGSGIAIQSTVARLREVLTPTPGTNINRVRYEDFDNAPIEKGQGAYFLVLKRKSFEHEREVRATLKLDTPGRGQEVPCDLERLIAGVYVSPKAHSTYVNAVKELCSGLIHGLVFPVQISKLYEPPDYDLDV